MNESVYVVQYKNRLSMKPWSDTPYPEQQDLRGAIQLKKWLERVIELNPMEYRVIQRCDIDVEIEEPLNDLHIEENWRCAMRKRHACIQFQDYGCGCNYCHDCGWERIFHTIK